MVYDIWYIKDIVYSILCMACTYIVYSIGVNI